MKGSLSFVQSSKQYKVVRLLQKKKYVSLPEIIACGIWSPATLISQLRKRFETIGYTIINHMVFDKKTLERHSHYSLLKDDMWIVYQTKKYFANTIAKKILSKKN